ncbi:tissue factor pathway inhibitor 2 isoform X3 [Heterocephalus glaber]|uniref:Tissue factor pathway inhibitor 2 isoform X3 n=1 Tax=Heterocephalus glaber TaxID=10181 RepID=A0AAX6PYL5_HETGA|nr:tissue factor pathway inhibitor 2 isoform X3 [Heterocephalus glaber]
MHPAGPPALWLLPLLLLGPAPSPASPERTAESTAICLLPSDPGLCRLPTTRYYYDRYTQTCRAFRYGGCGGNANQFATLEACDEACWMIEVPSFCYSPKDEGLCFANETRYYFNMRRKACATFTYTGCGGNDNNFSYLKDCQRVCEKAYKRGKRKTQKPPFSIKRPKTWKKIP